MSNPEWDLKFQVLRKTKLMDISDKTAEFW